MGFISDFFWWEYSMLVLNFIPNAIVTVIVGFGVTAYIISQDFNAYKWIAMIALVLFAICHLVTISVCLISDGMLLAVLCMGVYKYILKRG